MRFDFCSEIKYRIHVRVSVALWAISFNLHEEYRSSIACRAIGGKQSSPNRSDRSFQLIELWDVEIVRDSPRCWEAKLSTKYDGQASTEYLYSGHTLNYRNTHATDIVTTYKGVVCTRHNQVCVCVLICSSCQDIYVLSIRFKWLAHTRASARIRTWVEWFGKPKVANKCTTDLIPLFSIVVVDIVRTV